ncbi:ECF transporter S component [Isobaculum melis]|uniref:Energy-coupling factor transport system substrate-specific component n=1 Tax=Isobaculum melis TaxID=142588 RepID=A0A1H9U4P3_9LACT|nr:ECF transporter S component [Isobaculum melis]SES04137.1 energy-coupling factor transport system substrate-specific component [Isobaculum melis]
MSKVKKNVWWLVFSLLFLLVLTVAISDQYYLLVSFLFLIGTMVPLYSRFEKKKIQSREIVFLAVLGAIAAASRVLFFAIPSVQPMTFVVIVSGMVLGSEGGFMIGATGALVSNMFLGQGPWTPWQMFSWSMIGLIAGLLKDSALLKNMRSRLLFGFVMGFLFGWVINLWSVIAYIHPLSWLAFIQAYIASFYFDLAHALSNVFFLWLFSSSWIKVMRRFQKKYGLLD